MQKVATRFRSSPRAAQAPAPRTTLSSNAVAPSQTGIRPRSRKTARLVARKLAFALAAFLSAFILTGIFASDSGRMRLLTSTIPKIDTAISFAGFGLNQVSVTGQRFTLLADIFEALALEKSPTFASFDAVSARARIETLSWVATAELRRVYPNQLKVTITERKPFALWQNGGGSNALVDKEGRVLSSIGHLHAPGGLARIKGPGAPKAAAELWAELTRHPTIKSRLREATRIGERRWTLTLTNDSRIELPAGAVSAALNKLDAWPGFARVKEEGGMIVDMRSPGRIAVRPNEPVGPTSSRPSSISELLEPAG